MKLEIHQVLKTKNPMRAQATLWDRSSAWVFRSGFISNARVLSRSGIAFLHSKQICHRDIKPQNAMLLGAGAKQNAGWRGLGIFKRVVFLDVIVIVYISLHVTFEVHVILIVLICSSSLCWLCLSTTKHEFIISEFAKFFNPQRPPIRCLRSCAETQRQTSPWGLWNRYSIGGETPGIFRLSPENEPYHGLHGRFGILSQQETEATDTST